MGTEKRQTVIHRWGIGMAYSASRVWQTHASSVQRRSDHETRQSPRALASRQMSSAKASVAAGVSSSGGQPGHDLGVSSLMPCRPSHLAASVFVLKRSGPPAPRSASVTGVTVRAAG